MGELAVARRHAASPLRTLAPIIAVALLGLSSPISSMSVSGFRVGQLVGLTCIFLLVASQFPNLGERSFDLWVFALLFVVAYRAIASLQLPGRFDVNGPIGDAGNYLTVWMAAKAFCDPRARRVFAGLYSFAFGFMALLLIAHLLGVGPAGAGGLFVSSKHGLRATGLFDNPNLFGAAQLAAVFLAASLVRPGEPLKSGNLFWTAVSFACGAGVFASQSRSCVVVLPVCLAAWLLLSPRGAVRKLAIGLLVVTVAAAPLWLGFAEAGGRHLERAVQQLARTDRMFEGSIVSERDYLFRNGVEMIRAFPMGVGYRNLGDVAATVTGLRKTPHNFVLVEIARAGVVIGLVQLAFWLSWPARALLHGRRRDRGAGPVTCYAIAAVGVLLVSLTHSMLDWVANYAIWALLVASVANATPASVGKARMGEGDG